MTAQYLCQVSPGSSRRAVSAAYAAGETQADLGRGLGLSQGQVSRKQSGTTAWSLGDLDRLAAHYGIPVPELLRGADHAVRLLPAARRAACICGTQATLTTAGTGSARRGR